MHAAGRRRLLAGAAAVVTVPALALPATGADTGTDDARLGTLVFRFNFNNGESLKDGTRVRDVSGHGNYGIVETSGKGHLTVEDGIGTTGKAAGYPGGCKRCGRALIAVGDDAGMDPNRRPFAFGVAVKLADKQAKAGKDPNLVQKGLLTQPGGQFKLELKGAKPRCVIRGAKGTVAVMSAKPVDDSTWHNLECRRIRKKVTLRVDGNVVATAIAATGKIANDARVTIGGKAVGPASDNDQYHGDLDNVFYSVKRLA